MATNANNDVIVVEEEANIVQLITLAPHARLYFNVWDAPGVCVLWRTPTKVGWVSTTVH